MLGDVKRNAQTNGVAGGTMAGNGTSRRPVAAASKADVTRSGAQAGVMKAGGKSSAGKGKGTTVGERIRHIRAERGWTQDRLAEAVGVSRSAVAQWETDRVGQVRTNLTRIADALDVSVEFLLHGDDKRAPISAGSGDELALLRLYRECDEEDRAFLLRTARKLARAAAG